ncbi:GHKL domain-containing protein [Companilactobacillus kimchii]|uniref:Sensor histidine kinase NatK-like C-terminal domain-containing protein n=2 Tax=Companilactobacillus kimchii TaxID=2801452 RepID=A0A210PDC3_9LACO|nr:GHKL domain-containing protein [Companilactobacillus kimchii]KAE9562292.1 hypothetical protein ATN91_06805 [Companilactobacillus kimchii]OWF34441.1 hypothetical protein LKACC12383_00354 [Companilactobacillus kimchii]GEO46365.1 histidine kinase [Companilactobacillus paralimentarius]
MVIIFIQLFMFTMYTKILIRDLRFKRVDLLFFIMNLGVTLGMTKFGQLAVIIGGLIAFLIYLLLLTKSFKVSIAIAAIIYCIEILIDHLVDIIFRIMKLDENSWILNSSILMLGIILAVGLYFFLRSDLEHNLQRDYRLSSTEMIFTSIILIIMIFLITVTEVMQENNLQNIIYNSAIILLFAIMFVVVHIARTKAINKDLELREQKARSESTNRYLIQIEQHYNELRKFRHEYQNTLLSFEEYLRTDDLEGLKKYYNTSIKPISVDLNQEKYKFEDIGRIGNKEIKGVVFNKLYAAQLDGIKVSFEAKNEIKDFYMDSLDLALAMGIIMDNAIEETRNQEHGTIQVGLIKSETEIVIIVQNSLRKNDIPVWKMKEAGFSSKGSKRGFGLKNLTEIINRNNRATLETMKLNNYFLQKITISTKG